MAKHSDRNGYGNAGAAVARGFDSIFTKSHEWLEERISVNEARKLRYPGSEEEARQTLMRLSDDATE